MDAALIARHNQPSPATTRPVATSVSPKAASIGFGSNTSGAQRTSRHSSEGTPYLRLPNNQHRFSPDMQNPVPALLYEPSRAREKLGWR